ncbi:MAG: glutathione S-transferase family protein [Variibacter sp.]
MITLHTFGPAFGLPDPSPFVTKLDILLKMSGQPYKAEIGGLRRAPKGKLPYVVDDGVTIADSTFIRWHLEKKYGIDFDRGLTAEQRAQAWAFEKMAEDNLYWTLVDARWTDDANFRKGPAEFFQNVPAVIRPLVVATVRRAIRKHMHGHGIGRHSNAEIVALGTRSINAIADALADRPFFFGETPSGVDATIFAFVAGALCPRFDTPIRVAAERHTNLRRYVGRMAGRYYPAFDTIAGCPVER